jgi:hypothetical protein
MVTVKRTTLVVLLAGVAFLMAMLMFGGGQGAAPGVAQAATAKSGSQATAKSTRSKAARSHKTRVKSHRAAVRAQRVAATTQADPTPETGAENESGNEPAGEPADGYEDPAGQDVQHGCPPACGPGEKG